MPKDEAASKSREEETEADRIRHLRKLIRNCPGIPRSVMEAEFTRVDERSIEASLIRIWADQRELGDDAVRQRRVAAMNPYVGKTLVCVLIRLPGASYTIEVDLSEERIVHWEWQAT